MRCLKRVQLCAAPCKSCPRLNWQHEVFLCGPLRISPISASILGFNAEIAEIRRGPQRKPDTRRWQLSLTTTRFFHGCDRASPPKSELSTTSVDQAPRRKELRYR